MRRVMRSACLPQRGPAIGVQQHMLAVAHEMQLRRDHDLPASEQSYAQGEGRPIFEAFSDPTMLTRLRTAALAGIPGTLGAIELAETNLRASDPNAMRDDRNKKFLGRCAALLWRKNGFKTAASAAACRTRRSPSATSTTRRGTPPRFGEPHRGGGTPV